MATAAGASARSAADVGGGALLPGLRALSIGKSDGQQKRDHEGTRSHHIRDVLITQISFKIVYLFEILQIVSRISKRDLLELSDIVHQFETQS
jgi:hypothetical protein